MNTPSSVAPVLFHVLLFVLPPFGTVTQDNPILSDYEGVSQKCDCQLLSEEDVSSIVQSVVGSLQPVVIQAVHDQVIHVSYSSKRNSEEVVRRLSDLEVKVAGLVGDVRKDIVAALEKAKRHSSIVEESPTSLRNTTDAPVVTADLLDSTLPSDSRLMYRGNASHCSEIQDQGWTESGVYPVIISGERVLVQCDLETDGGGWTVIQRRDDVPHHVDFNRGWDDYKRGFGHLETEFWLGLDNIHGLTSSSTPMRLRVDLEDWDGEKAHSEYDVFRVGDGRRMYRLHVRGYRDGVGWGGDSLSFHHSGRPFTTRDRDNDDSASSNCAQLARAPWWYGKCHWSNLNGVYLQQEGHKNSFNVYKGVVWDTWKGNTYSLRRAEMKVRPSRDQRQWFVPF